MSKIFSLDSSVIMRRILNILLMSLEIYLRLKYGQRELKDVDG